MNDVVERHMLPGERVIGQGLPYAGLVFRPIEAFLIPFSLLWGGFAVFWNSGVWTGDAPLSFKLFGLPFLFGGIYVTVGRFWLDMWLRRQLLYVLTDRRILILKRHGAATSRSLDIKRLPALELAERSDGSGTIRFGASGGLFSRGNFGIWQPTFDQTPQFIRIPDARSVYQLIEQHAE